MSKKIEVVLRTSDVDPSGRLGFPEIKLPVEEKDGQYHFFSSTGKSCAWLNRALYLFKNNQQMSLRVYRGSMKSVILDGEHAFSLEYIKSRIIAKVHLIRRVKLQNLRHTPGIIVPDRIRPVVYNNPEEGVLLFQRAARCDPKDLFCTTMRAYHDRDITRILQDCIHTIMPGLDEAHSKGIYHQDVKVENIFLHDGTWCLGDWEGGVILDSKPDVFSKEKHFTYSAMSAIFQPDKSRTAVELRLNDVTAMCFVVITLCARLGLFCQRENRGPALQYMWNEYNTDAYPSVSNMPYAYCPNAWRELCSRVETWDKARYEAMFAKLRLNPFSRTVEVCLKTIASVGEQRFHGAEPDTIPNVAHELKQALAQDVISHSPLRKKRPQMVPDAPRANRKKPMYGILKSRRNLMHSFAHAIGSA